MEKSFHKEKESVDKEWLKLTLDRYYHPEKYFTPEEITIKPTFGELFDNFLEKHPLSEVRIGDDKISDFEEVENVLLGSDLTQKIVNESTIQKGGASYLPCSQGCTTDEAMNVRWIRERNWPKEKVLSDYTNALFPTWSDSSSRRASAAA